MHITVYLGASCGTDPHLAQAVRELGAWIGAAGHTLVYGGSKTGLMGLLAQSALAQGGSVIGVEPEGANCMEQSLKKGEVICLDHSATIADGTAVRQPGKLIFPYIDRKSTRLNSSHT